MGNNNKGKKAPYKARLKLRQPGVSIVGNEMYLHALESTEPLKYCVKFLGINYDTAIKSLETFMDNNPSISENITLAEIISYEKLQDYEKIKEEAKDYAYVLRFCKTAYALDEDRAYDLICELFARYGELEIKGYQEAKQKKEVKPYIPSEPIPADILPVQDISCTVDNAMEGMQVDEDDYKAVKKMELPEKQPAPAKNEKEEKQNAVIQESPVKKIVKDNTEALKDLARKLKEARIKSNISQNRLAQAIGTKFPSNIKKWEEGTTTPSLEMLKRLAKALKMPTNYFEKEIDMLRKMKNPEDPEEETNNEETKEEMNAVVEKNNEETIIKKQVNDIQNTIRKPVLERVIESYFIDYLKAPFANKGIVIGKIDASEKIISEYVATKKYSSLKDLIQAVKDIQFVLNHIVEGNDPNKDTDEHKKMVQELQTVIDELNSNIRMPAEPVSSEEVKHEEKHENADKNEEPEKSPEETGTEEILNDLNEKEKFALIRYRKADRAHAELVSAYPCVQDEKELQVLKDAAEILRQKREFYKAEMSAVADKKKELKECAKAMEIVQKLGYKITKA